MSDCKHECKLTAGHLRSYADHLRQEEKSTATMEKYLRNIRAFARWLGDSPVSREAVAGWKETLLDRGRSPATVNGVLASLNSLFRFLGWEGCRTRFLRVQRRLFRDQSRELLREEYEALTAAARAGGRERLALLMEAICATGIRVSEVRCLTVEAVRAGQAVISLKGKIRTILLPGKLCRKLLRFAREQGIAAGPVFRTRNGTPLSRRQIWAEMKGLCSAAGVAPSKVFPHNFRHLFAVTFYRASRDLVKLADVLGHSSIETTRIYLIASGEEHQRQLDRLGLVL